MSRIMDRIRAATERSMRVQGEWLNRQMEEQHPIARSDAPPLEELQRILADLQKTRQTRRNIFLKDATR